MNTTTTKIPTYIGAAGEIEKFAMANCRFMLQNAAVSSVVGASNSGEHVGRMFDCKTCGGKFSSFQALGGHRASHKKAKLPNSGELSEESNIPVKPKIHACKICGVEFPIGQALGGHMRRHREMLEGNNNNGDDNNKILMITSAAMSGVTNEGSSGNSDANNDNSEKKRKNAAVDDEEVVLEVPVVTKKSSSCKRVRLDLDLDLSLWWKNEVVDEYNGDHEVEDEKDSLKLDLSLPTNYC